MSELAARCRFSDCAHESEPGCAVQEALGDGTLDPERWTSYRKLQRELAALERKLDARAKSEDGVFSAQRAAPARAAASA